MPRRSVVAPIVAPAQWAILDAEPMRRSLLAWYDDAGRTLPFRGATDPWAVLVSEAMAQQTQAARAGEAWRSFMAAYPTPAALSAASPADVLRAWRGLGYNRRAVALRAAAVVIVEEHGGRVPAEIAALERLPGVGPYTARAVAALAFGQPVGPVDTNVRRVLGRLVDSGAAATSRGLQDLADTLVDRSRPGDWTHALMDVGATVCRPIRPDCPACPLAAWCVTARRRDPGAPDGVAVQAFGRGSGPAGSGRRLRRLGDSAAPYRSTSRWLRGRIVDRLRDAADGRWVRLDGGFGDHGAEAIADAVGGLERDGLLERDPSDPALVRLPASPSEAGTAR